MKLADRVDKIEEALIAHLTESGEIKSDLKWLKRGMWWVIGGGLVFNLYHLWR